MLRTTGDKVIAVIACVAVVAAGVAWARHPEAAAVPGGPGPTAQPAPTGAPGSHQGYSVEQAVSDRAQQTTIAFDALGFLTGSAGADSFFPPGKVSDFWGFQYLRDNDTSELGHSGDFLTKVAFTTYSVLDEAQRAKLSQLAEAQADDIAAFGMKRLTLTAAFRRLLECDLPAGTGALDAAAVGDYAAGLYRLDGEISYRRAEVMGAVLRSLSASQRARFEALAAEGVGEWPDVAEPEGLRGLDRDQKVGVMTSCGDLFSWYAGSVDADVYFCPERHGTYFGSFYLKDAKAMADPSYAIPTSVTGDMGERFLAALSTGQAATITGLVDEQRDDLQRIVEVRRAVATRLRRFQTGTQVDEAQVLELMAEYGRLDGALSSRYAAAFAAVGKKLTASQKKALAALRREMLGGLEPQGAFLYSEPIPTPDTPETDFLFGAADSSESSGSASIAGTLTLTSSAFADGGTLPVRYSGDGAGVSPPLAWSGAPAGTKGFALTMATQARDGEKWNWVLYDVPAGVTSLEAGTEGVGTTGASSDGPESRYYPPKSKGPGPKTYTFTLYALSGKPETGGQPAVVDGPALTAAVRSMTLASSTLSVTYIRQ